LVEQKQGKKKTPTVSAEKHVLWGGKHKKKKLEKHLTKLKCTRVKNSEKSIKGCGGMGYHEPEILREKKEA